MSEGRLVSLNVSDGGVPKRPVAGCAGGDLNRVSHKLHPGWSRLYARVLQEGLLQVGDTVTLA
jgi:hypothetical protein